MEIDEIAARLLRQYWALLVIRVAVPLVAISFLTTKQPSMYAASARIITDSVVSQSSAAVDAVASQVEALATGPRYGRPSGPASPGCGKWWRGSPAPIR